MMEIFTWAPANGPTGTVSFKLNEAQFGDGYSQRAPDGLNHRRNSWPVTFRGDLAKITAIAAFLDARGGAEAFLWTPPGGTQGAYVAKEYQRTVTDALTHSIAATFEQVAA